MLYTESGYTQSGANFFLKKEQDLMGIVGKLMDLRRAMVFERLAFQERALKMEGLLANGSVVDGIKASLLMCEGLAEIIERLEYGEKGRIDRQITEYMETHISEKLHVDTIARHFSISPSQLQRLCHRYFGMSAMALYAQKRINKAKVLLRSTENSINEIAGAVGFDEVANFSAFFTKSTGMTPSGFRLKRKRSTEEN